MVEIRKYEYMRSMYLSVNRIFICSLRLRSLLAPAAFSSSVTRSLVKKYSIKVSGRAKMERTVISVIHFDLSTPMLGMMTMGNTSATRMPLIMMVVIWLKTDNPPRAVVSRVLSGTIRLWLILKIV